MSKNLLEKTFSDFLSINQDTKITVKGVIHYTSVEKIGINILAFIPSAIIYYNRSLHIMPLPLAWVVKIALMVFVFILAKKIIRRLPAVKIFEINKEKKEIKANLEEFNLHLGEIQNILIDEEGYQKDGQETRIYRIKFILPNGEKTADFAFSSYNKAEELLNVIKSAT